MSLQFIGLFQKSLYEILNTDAELKNMIPQIYISVQQDAKYPFILLSFLHLNDVSKYSKKIYEMEFEISIFTRDKLQENTLRVAEHISKLIREKSIGVGEGNLVSLSRNSLEWVRGNEITSGKMVMKYMGRISN